MNRWEGHLLLELHKNVPVVGRLSDMKWAWMVQCPGEDVREELNIWLAARFSCTQVCSCELVSGRRTDELSVYLQAERERLRGRSFAEHALIEKVDTHIHTHWAWSLRSRAAYLKTTAPMLLHRLTPPDTYQMKSGRVYIHKLWFVVWSFKSACSTEHLGIQWDSVEK